MKVVSSAARRTEGNTNAMGIQTSLDAVAQSERLIDAMRLADELAFEANRDGGARTIRVLSTALDTDDSLVAIAATHALGQVFDEQVDIVLSGLLSDDRRFLREHAAWVLGSRLPRYDTIGRLIARVADGGFSGMLAQRTLEQWSSSASAHVAIGLEGALLGIREPERRARVVETLGLVRHRMAALPLIRIARDVAEGERVRVAAISALGQRRGDLEIAGILDTLTVGDGMLADVARLSLVDLWAGIDERDAARSGLTVAQLFLHADIDALLTQAGSGDNGGIATLLVRLGDALVTGGGVERVITMSRGSVAEALDSIVDVAAAASGHLYGRVPLLTDAVASADAWPLRVAARRGIRRILRAAGGVDMLHLRMADVGSLAAADVARELDIPVVFTVAPDPHVVIQSLDLSGALTRANFGHVDETDHFWFRGRLVQRLASNAAHTVLFPRHNLQRDMSQLLGIDITAHPERHSIVPEGIDLEVVDEAVSEAAELAAGLPATPPLAQLAQLLEQLPIERRGLPLFVSVGRFHRVKGMAAIVDAWAHGPLAALANLILIGGSLADPSPDEREQLDAIDRIIPADARAEHGLLLPGHQPNDVVARWVAAVRFGIPGLAAPRGVYVCGSVKEEFGIALLEGMASGLIVVAPDGGGPATYVTQGDTGFLTRTWDVSALRAAMGDALAAASRETSEERADRSRETVAASFTIQAMAHTLAGVYETVNIEENELRETPAAAR
jgi:glycosyltransferase involved in cell wall biosynthesis